MRKHKSVIFNCDSGIVYDLGGLSVTFFCDIIKLKYVRLVRLSISCDLY